MSHLLFTEAELQAVKNELRKIGERQIRVHGEGSKGVGLMIAIPLPYEPDTASRWFLLKPGTPIVDEVVSWLNVGDFTWDVGEVGLQDVCNIDQRAMAIEWNVDGQRLWNPGIDIGMSR